MNMQQVTRFVDPEDNELSPSQGVAKIESLSDRDAGFCSGEEEETDLDTEYHSPTDASRDSLDSKENSVESYRSNKNKRKCIEPRRVGDDPKRRILDISSSINRIATFDTTQTETYKTQSNPFRPWSADEQQVSSQIPEYTATYQLPVPSGYDPKHHEEVDTSIQEEPLSLVVTKKQYSQCTSIVENYTKNLYQPCRTETPDNISFSPAQEPRPQDVVRINNRTKSQNTSKGRNNIKSKTPHEPPTIKNSGFSSSICSSSSQEEKKSSLQLGNSAQRNYKNMTRERRIEANARERTRVHTISAAFDTLRRSVPAYASDQKLSKLSVLRIACSYIMTLSRIAGYDYSEDHTQPSIADCVDNVCSTIQLEGKTRKKKDE